MSFDLVFFGGTGDLTWRKLMPALFQAWRHGKLPEGGRILSVARDERSDDDYRQFIRERFVEVPVERVVDKVVEIERIVEKPVYNQRIVEKPVEKIVEEIRAFPSSGPLRDRMKALYFVDDNLQGMQQFNAPGRAVEDSVQVYFGINAFF